jgi:hypothetical protein
MAMPEDLSRFCCQDPHCPDYGQRGHGNLTVCGQYGKTRSIRLLYCRTCKACFSEMTSFTIYSSNFCWAVRTLNERDEQGRMRQRSPAMAADLADHVWTMREWITTPAVQCA